MPPNNSYMYIHIHIVNDNGAAFVHLDFILRWLYISKICQVEKSAGMYIAIVQPAYCTPIYHIYRCICLWVLIKYVKDIYMYGFSGLAGRIIYVDIGSLAY